MKPQSQNVAYAQRRNFRWPWQDRLQEVSKSQALEALNRGEESFVKGPEQERFLPMRSVQDFQEFQASQEGEVSKELASPALFESLQALKKRGVRFLGTSDGERSEIGVYGAYNLLQGELDLFTLQVAFQQPGPLVMINKASTLQLWSEEWERNQDQIDSWLTATPTQNRSTHEHVLTLASLISSQPSEVLNYVQKRLLHYQESRGYVIRLYKDVLKADSVSKSPHWKELVKLSEQREEDGESMFSELSQIDILQAASNPKLAGDELGRVLLNVTFTERKQKLIANTMAPLLHPHRVESIDQWLETAPPSLITPSREELLLFTLENPEVSGHEATLNYFLDKPRDSNHRDLANVLARFSLTQSQVPDLRRSQLLVEICEEKGQDQELLLTPTLQKQLLTAAIDSEFDPSQFLKELLSNTPQADLQLLSQKLTLELLGCQPSLEKPAVEKLWHELFNGEYLGSEMEIVIESLTAGGKTGKPSPDIRIEEDHLLIDNEVLEVDL